MSKQTKHKLPAKDWLPFFEAAGILSEELEACKSERSRAIKLGQFLSTKVGREVPIQVGDRTGKATLESDMDRANTKVYYLRVVWDTPPPPQVQLEDDKLKEEIRKKTKKSKKQRADSTQRPDERKSSAATQGNSRSGSSPAEGMADQVRTTTRVEKAEGNSEDWS